MTVAEIRQQLEGLPDDLWVNVSDLEIGDCFSIYAIDVIYDGEPSVPIAVEFDIDTAEHDKDEEDV